MASKNKDVSADVRMSALLLSALVKAADHELEGFLDKRGLDIAERDLMRVRDLLRELGAILKQPDDPRWAEVAKAHEAIVGADPDAATDEDGDPEDAEATDEDAPDTMPPASLGAGDIEPPPSLADLLGGPEPDASIATYPPSPWTSPTRAAEAANKPALISPAAPIPTPPALVVPNDAVEAPVAVVADEPSTAEHMETSDDDELEEEEGRRDTQPPMDMSEEAMPFRTAQPNPETPDAKSLPPSALASVIAGLPPMTVVSYAALCASCDALPQRAAETHAKFGVTGDVARKALDAVWQTKLEEDERLHILWMALTTQFRDWLVRLR